MLYDYIRCPGRPGMDAFHDPGDRDPVSPFVQLLWEKGTLFEQEVIDALEEEYTDLKTIPPDQKENATHEAIARQDRLIYGGRICYEDLLGEPDLLRFQNGGYVAGDIKSGAGLEGGSDIEDGKPKKHYGVQLAFYTDILERKGISSGRYPFVWDIHGEEIVYDLDAPQGSKTPASLWNVYQEALDDVRNILNGRDSVRPALSSDCKLCHWYTACNRVIVELNDLTLIPNLGRSKRDTMIDRIPTVEVLVNADINEFIEGRKTIFKGIGIGTLEKLQERARLQCSQGQPYLTSELELNQLETELFFDIETDPMRDICYLHGFVERNNGDNNSEQYIQFFADQPVDEQEREAFSQALAYINEKMPCAVYYYSSYEKTQWKKLARKYPDVASEEEIEELFNNSNMVDLYYGVVTKQTMWPTINHSIKTLASYLGFDWRDESPSGAASIEWYNRWVETQNEEIKTRILEYNEDDCRATRVLLDGLRELPVNG